MEIIDYLRIARRRWWILVAVPVLAGLAATALILTAPASYTSVATVSSGSLVNSDGSPFTGTQATAQFVAAFTAASQNPQTRQAVLAETSVKPTDQADGIQVDAVGASSDIQVSFTSDDRAVSAAVAQATAKETLKQMFTVRANQAVATRDRAQESTTEANAAIDALAKKYQIADPPRAYQAQLNQVATLQQQQVSLRAGGNAIGAAAMDAPIAQAKKGLAAYLPILAAYNDLNSRQVAASSDLTQAQAEWRHALSLKAAATSDGIVYLGPTSAVDKQAALVATLPVIVAAGLFLAVVLILLIEVSKRLRATQGDADEPVITDGEPETDPAAVVAERDVTDEELAPSTETVHGDEPLDAHTSTVVAERMLSTKDEPGIRAHNEHEAASVTAKSRV